ncbi:MAG: hypothetical protein IKO53_04580 [Lachnospiraceae bacterium]|nr:hypothetical protein [Lachnospiraceae bacterium]
MDETGFLGLISNKNRLSCVFDKENTTGQLGFKVLNDYFSAKLFPGISTLMPNLVYCYLIFSITWGKELNDGKINEMLCELTTEKLESLEKKSLADKQLGFHGKVDENVSGTYRGFMERYGFFEGDEQLLLGNLNKWYAEFKSNRREKSRYKNICDFFANRQHDDVEISPRLNEYEIKDMIQRCLIASGIQYNLLGDKKGFQIKRIDEDATPSLFDLTVLKYACICKGNDKFEYKFSEKITDIPAFERLGEVFDIEIKGKKLREYYSDLYRCYEAARFSTVMQYYIKCRSNQLIREEKLRIRGERIDHLKKDLNRSLFLQNSAFNWEGKQLDEMENIFNDRDDCKEKMRCLREIYESITNSDNEKTDKIILKIIHESDSSGQTCWNRGESTEYLDTYRWEYRPRNNCKDDSNVQNRIMVFEREPGKNTKCASYFVGELCRYEKN